MRFLDEQIERVGVETPPQLRFELAKLAALVEIGDRLTGIEKSPDHGIAVFGGR